MRVTVVPYDPEWPLTFASLRSALHAALTAGAVPTFRIEHVGSTSVPGLAAKPVIDIDVIVPRAHVQSALAALSAVGYTPVGNLGIADRDMCAAPADGIARNVYVAVEGSLGVRNHLAVRDTLRSDEALRDRYGALKLALSQRDYTGIDGYIADKSTLLQEVLALGGISAEERAVIAASNR